MTGKTTTVIILHPDLELSLVNFQKKLICDLNLFLKSFDFDLNFPENENAFFYAFYPLWIFLRQDFFSAKNKEDLKKISRKIIGVNFEDFLFYENGDVNIGAKIKTTESEYRSKLTIAKFFKPEFLNENQQDPRANRNLNKTRIENHLKTKKTPFNDAKIFRLGICEKISENSQNISEFAWAKKNS